MALSIIRFLVGLSFSWALLPFFGLIKLGTYISARLKFNNVKGQVVLITGASSGIGKHLSYEYAKRGACLVIVARRENMLEKVAEKARKLGSPEVVPICADVQKVDDCRRFVEETVNHFGRLDHVVNNAGIASMSLIEDANDITKFTPVMDVNFWGSVYPTYFAIPHLRKTKGSIFVNASSGAIMNTPGMSFYSASKAALVSFYDTMRIELAPEISITVATLGLIDSEMTRGKHLNSEGIMAVKPFLKRILSDRLPVMGTSDCAEAIVEAICRKERYITEPKWCSILFVVKALCPELIEWAHRLIYFRIKKSNLAKTTSPPPPSSSNKLD